jgi:hypothetical protein
MKKASKVEEILHLDKGGNNQYSLFGVTKAWGRKVEVLFEKALNEYINTTGDLSMDGGMRALAAVKVVFTGEETKSNFVAYTLGVNLTTLSEYIDDFDAKAQELDSQAPDKAKVDARYTQESDDKLLEYGDRLGVDLIAMRSELNSVGAAVKIMEMPGLGVAIEVIGRNESDEDIQAIVNKYKPAKGSMRGSKQTFQTTDSFEDVVKKAFSEDRHTTNISNGVEAILAAASGKITSDEFIDWACNHYLHIDMATLKSLPAKLQNMAYANIANRMHTELREYLSSNPQSGFNPSDLIRIFHKN